MEQYFPLVLLALAFVLLIVLPARQRKRVQAQAQAMQESLTPGTPVMTTAGLHGTVAGLGEGTVDLEIAPGVVVTFARQAILEVRKPAGPAVGSGPAVPGDDATGPSDGGPTDRTL
ncbi:preprotein translocase subunit YajC [Geodermatophilus sabuli]|uniref:Preprotein translocase subunit YajC n=1 Tax=Geodermatophilus sabuli TaxID=1564158 RepID=A0A7K3W0T6_9ACTN|nr:preprotein translocase subunit YajC [Geodermatophilus sabuli]